MKTLTRIAANDPALAHSLTRLATRQTNSAVAAKLKAMLPPRAGMTVSKVSRAVRLSFGRWLIAEMIGKLHGTRANATWLTLVTISTDDVVPMCLDYRQQWLHHSLLAFRFRQHALARLAQRTVGAADMDVMARIMGQHFLVTVPLLIQIEEARPPGQPLTRFSTSTTDGTFLWKREEDGWVAGTWIDPQSAADPTVTADVAKLVPGKGLLKTLD